MCWRPKRSEAGHVIRHRRYGARAKWLSISCGRRGRHGAWPENGGFALARRAAAAPIYAFQQNRFAFSALDMFAHVMTVLVIMVSMLLCRYRGGCVLSRPAFVGDARRM